MGRKDIRKGTIGAAFIDEKGVITGLHRVCPNCGMVDYDFSNQGIGNAHFQIWRVGTVRKYQCGKCRKYFKTIELVVPEGMTEFELYEICDKALEDNQHPQDLFMMIGGDQW